MHIDELKYVVERWRMEYNDYRMHSSLSNMTPAELAKLCIEVGCFKRQKPWNVLKRWTQNRRTSLIGELLTWEIDMSLFYSFLSNIAMMFAVAAVYSFASKSPRNKKMTARIISGFAFSIAVLTTMQNKFVLTKGVVFDARSVVISVCGMFARPISVFITSITAIIHRIWTGGGGTFTGICVVSSSALIGLLFRHLRKSKPQLTKTVTVLALFLVLVVFAGTGRAETRPAGVTAEGKAELEAGAEVQAKAKAEQKDNFTQVGVAEDTSPKLVVKEIKISGNTLVSTTDLLANMPDVYIVPPKGNSSVKEMYDFRILREIILEPGQAREVSRNTVQGFTRYILAKYKEKKYAGIYVYVSAKAVKGAAELEEGVLPIEIIEGKVAKITIDRYDFDRNETEKKVLKDSVLKSWSPAKEGQTIKKKELDDFVRLLNLNPDRYISAVISKGDKPDTLNLGYDVYEANPWHWYAQVDNSGTDKRQWNPRVGVTNTNLTGRDDRVSLMYQAPPDGLENNYALFGNYEFPFFTPRLRLGVYAGYSQFQITPETGAGINFRGNGSFYGSTLRYNVFQIDDWFFDVLGSLSHESSRVTPSLGIEADVDMDLLGTGAELHRSSNMSDTSFSFNRFKSIGGSDKDDFTKARLDTEPDFSIYTLSAAHRQFLSKSKIHELSGSFRGITSDQRLIPAKMTAFGGLYSVRGYKEDGIVADGGVLASLQYRFDLTKYMEKGTLDGEEKSDFKRNKQMWPPRVSLLAFTDYGQAKIKDPVPGETETQDLLGVGIGTAVELGEHVYAAVYYSVPLRSTDDTEKGDGRWNFNFIYRW